MRALLLGTLACLTVACAGGGYAGEAPEVAERASCTVELAVPTMSCGEVCPGRVKAALAAVDGVQDVSVDFGSRSAEVTAEYPACSSSGFGEMLENLHDAGYDGQIVSSN